MLRKLFICFVILILQGVLIFPNVFGLNGGHKTIETQSRTVPGTFNREALKHLSKIFLPLEQHVEKPRLFGAQMAETEKSDADRVPLNNDPVPASLFPKIAYSRIVMPLSEKYGVDWRLVSAVMEVESGYQVTLRAAESLQEIARISQTAAALAGDISLASQKQVDGAESAAGAVQSIASAAAYTEREVTQGRQTVDELARLAEELTAKLARFKLAA